MFDGFRKGITGETGMVFTGSLISGLLSFAGTLLAIRGLEPSQFGLLALLTAVMTFVAQFLDLGLGTTFVKFTSQRLQTDPDRAKLTLHVTFLVKVVLSVALLVVGYLTSGLLARLFLHDEALAPLLFLSLTGSVGILLWEFCKGYLQATERFKELAYIMPVRNLFRLIVLGLLFVLHSLDLNRVVLATIGAPFVGFVLGWVLIPHSFMRAGGERMPVIRELYRFTRWITLSSVATMFIMRLDIFMLEALATSDQVGFYASANQLAYLFPLITGSVTTVLLPRVSRYKSHGELRTYNRRVISIAPAIFIVFIPFVLVAPYLIPFLMGESYLGAVPIFRVLVMSFTISVIVNPAALVFYNLDRPDLLAYLNLLQLAINFWFNLWLIPIHGAVGAAIGTLIVRIFGGVYIGVFMYVLLYRRGSRDGGGTK